jgi:dUTP pyrophosphatase
MTVVKFTGRRPTRAHPTDAGLDLYADEAGLIPCRDSLLVKTGTKVAIPDGFVGLVCARSGLSVKNHIEKGAGVIDSSYRGELRVHLYNHSEIPYQYEAGAKIAQLLILPCWTGEPEEVENLDETIRGNNGFGSTGQ